MWRLYVFYCGRMDGGSVSGSRPAVPTGVLLAGELPWVSDLRLREVASFRRGGGGGRKRRAFLGVVFGGWEE